MSGANDAVTAEVTDLLQQMIRNACVNDGSVESGEEIRNADLLTSYLEGGGLDLERYEPAPGRTSLVARIEGSAPRSRRHHGAVGGGRAGGTRADAPTLLLMGHTDVVPANPDGWQRDPFGGELVGDEVWGRGAVDMLNLTASMAVAMRRLATSGFQPEGTLVYLAVADEEALGSWGAEHLAEHETDAVQADYVITESGGIPIPGGDQQLRLPVLVGEKGSCWCKLRVRGTPGHASQPWATDNALVTAAEVVRRLAAYQPETRIHETWRRFIEGMGYPDEMIQPLLDPERFMETLGNLPEGMARQFHACTHTTIAPTVVHGGVKTNVIPDQVDIQLDIRTLPGDDLATVRMMVDEALGDLADRAELLDANDSNATHSPIDSPLWDSLGRITQSFYDGSHLVPYLNVGATDARFFRRLGVTSYGFGLFSQKLTFEDYGRMFHGDDERVDVDSLRLSTELWEALAQDLLT